MSERGDPLVVTAMREFKAGVRAREDTQMHAMATHWLTVEQRLESQIAALSADFEQRRNADEPISRSALYRMDRYKRLRAQVEDDFSQYAAWADGTMTRYQQQLGELGIQHATEAMQMSYFEHGVAARFDRLPIEAVQNIAGIAGDGRPLGDLLHARLSFDPRMDNNSLDVWRRLVGTLVDGTAQGKNPREVARGMADDLAGGLNKALTIARTEGMRPYREMSRAAYERSGVVVGQKRLTGHDDRVCAGCLADEGTIYGLDEVIPDHPNGRCTSVPVVRGLPVVEWEGGQTWFLGQDRATQIAILGPGKLKALEAGQFAWRDLVARRDHAVWGGAVGPRSLADLLAGTRDPGPPAIDISRPVPVASAASRAPSENETRLRADIDEIRPLVEQAIAAGDPTGAGLKSYMDNLTDSLREEEQINSALWEMLGIRPENATDLQWARLADRLTDQGLDLYKKYTKEGIASFVSEERGAKDSGYMVVGSEQIQIKQGAFSARQAQRMEGELWAEAKEDLSKAMGALLQKAGYTPGEIAQADYFHRLRLLEETGRKSIIRKSRGRHANIDKVPYDARDRVVAEVDVDLAATCARSSDDPLALPTLDAYGKMELADVIRKSRLGIGAGPTVGGREELIL